MLSKGLVSPWITGRCKRCLTGLYHATSRIHAFLGLTGYYQCLIKGYDDIATLLMALLRKDAFRWGPEVDVVIYAL
jgi:hypothetical protein